MGEPPLQLHDWFAAVATSLLPGDRELAVVFHGRVETADGLDTRPTALQLVKRLGADAFRTQWEGQARTVKLVGPLARDRAVAGGVDDVAIATFKDGISPHFEFFLHAAREQRPTKVNLRAAFPPPSKQLASVPSPQPTHTSRQSTPPRRSAFLDLRGVHDEQLAGAPGSMHELAEGLRRARQLRRPLGPQGRSASTAEERPVLQADRDAGWARRAVASAADGLETGPPERRQSQMTKSTAKDYAEVLPAAISRPDALTELPSRTAKVDSDSGTLIQQGNSTDLGAAQEMEEAQVPDQTNQRISENSSASLIRIDRKPKTLKQALAATVVRFFAASHSLRQPPPPIQSRDPPAAEASTPVDPVLKSSPRRPAARISRFQATVTASLQRSGPLRASSESPVEPPNEAIKEDGGDLQRKTRAEPLAEEPMAVVSVPFGADTMSGTTTIEVARDEVAPGGLTYTTPSATADTGESDQRKDSVADGDVPPLATAGHTSASPGEQIEKAVRGGSPAADDVSTSAARPTASLAVAFAEVEPSSDRHSSVEPAFRSSQGFSSMYGESEPEDDDDDVGKAAEEISAFIARDLASSVVDEEEDAERASAAVERPLGDANLIAEQPVIEAPAEAEAAIPGAEIDLAAAALEARARTEESTPLVSAAAASDSDVLDAIPVPEVTDQAASSADVVPLDTETEEEPIGVQAESPSAPSGLEREREPPFQEPPPPQLRASDLPRAIPTPEDAEPRLPTPPLSPRPTEFSAPAEDYYAPEESKDAYFTQEEELPQTSAERQAADDIMDVASLFANEGLQEQPLPSDSRSSSAAGVSSPQRTQAPQLFRDDSIDPYADITDEGALAALAALRSSPASTPEYAENVSRGSSVDVFGQKRYLHKSGSASQPVSSTRARTTSAGGKEVYQPEVAHPASDGPRNCHEPATKKRRRKASPNFTLEFFASKSPRKRATPTQPPLEPARPVASTSRVTLDDLAERNPSNCAEAAKSRTNDQAARVTAELEQDASREHTHRSTAIEAADLDYNSDSDDPLSAPIRPARLSASALSRRAGKPGRSRRVLSDERDSDEEEESQIVEQALLPQPARPRPRPTAATGMSQPLNGGAQQRDGRQPQRRPPMAPRDLPKPPRKPSLAGKIRPEALPASSQGAPARPRATLQTRPPLGDESRHSGQAAHKAAPSSASRRGAGVGDDARGQGRRKRSRPQSEEASDSEAERAPPTAATQRPLQERDRPSAQKKPAARGQARRPVAEEATQYARAPPRPIISHTERPRSSSRGSVDFEDGVDDGPQHVGEESGNDSDQAPTPARPPPTQPKSTKKRKKRKSIVMPRSKSRKRPSTTTPKPTKARSPSPELTASPEPAPRSSATKAGQKRRRAEPGGRGSKKARQAYDHAEWGEDESD